MKPRIHRHARIVLTAAVFITSCAHKRQPPPRPVQSHEEWQRAQDAAQRAEINKCVHDRLQEAVPQPMYAGEVDTPALEFMCASGEASVSLSTGDLEVYRCTSFRGFALPVSVRISRTRYGVSLSASQLERRTRPEGAYGSATSQGFPDARWTEFVSPLKTPRAEAVGGSSQRAPEWFLEHISATGITAIATSSISVNTFCKGLLDVAKFDPDHLRKFDVRELKPSPGEFDDEERF